MNSSSRSAQPIQALWIYCPCCGTQTHSTGSNPFRCAAADCGYIHYFGPCSAVGAIITDPAGQVLLLIRGRDPGRGLLGLPGGFVDPGETAEEALHREVFEETQLQISHFRYLVSFPNQYAYAGAILPVTDLFFVVTVESLDSLRVEDGEIEAWQFCHPTQRELERMAFGSNRRALEVFLAERGGAGIP